jgi:hypothetical protein
VYCGIELVNALLMDKVFCGAKVGQGERLLLIGLGLGACLGGFVLY